MGQPSAGTIIVGNAIIRRKSVRNCLKSRCENGLKDFWDTVKPFFTDKGKCRSNRIMLSNNGNYIDSPQEVVSTFN